MDGAGAVEKVWLYSHGTGQKNPHFSRQGRARNGAPRQSCRQNL